MQYQGDLHAHHRFLRSRSGSQGASPSIPHLPERLFGRPLGAEARLSQLITTVFRIDATIRILAPPSPVASSSGAAPVARVESAATEGEDELPTFADAMASSSTTLGGAVTVVAETSDAGAELVYEQVPQEVALRSLVRSTGGSVIRVKHGETYEGSFTVSFHQRGALSAVSSGATMLMYLSLPSPLVNQTQATCPITHTASVSMPSAPTSRGTRSIRCDIEKRNHIGGIVGYEVSTHEGLSRTVIESGGGAEFVFA